MAHAAGNRLKVALLHIAPRAGDLAFNRGDRNGGRRRGGLGHHPRTFGLRLYLRAANRHGLDCRPAGPVDAHDQRPRCSTAHRRFPLGAGEGCRNQPSLQCNICHRSNRRNLRQTSQGQCAARRFRGVVHARNRDQPDCRRRPHCGCDDLRRRLLARDRDTASCAWSPPPPVVCRMAAGLPWSPGRMGAGNV